MPDAATAFDPTSNGHGPGRVGGVGPESTEAAGLASEAIGPEVGLLAGLDSVGFGRAFGAMAASLPLRPGAVFHALARFGASLGAGALAAAARTLGVEAPPALVPEPRDRRFADPAWQRHPLFFGLQQSYLAWARCMLELVDAAGLDDHNGDRARLAMGLVVDGLSPTNFLPTNPVALRRAVDTGGRSALAGVHNFLNDLATNGGRPRQVDASGFRVGGNLAATPGKVVFQNELMELIQYEPSTRTVYEIPLLCSPPWINKYYVMDLAPGRSFIEWAVANGHTTFAISYRNPDESMRNVALDDYLLSGPHQALDVMADITGNEQANIVGLCLGGTLTTMLLAHLAATERERVRSATLLNTLVDFSEPGPMGCFLDKVSVEHLDRKMTRKGYLDAAEMSTMFDLLRARDLIWNYVESNWLLGEQPPAFDILAWNADGTRMPAEMHSFYLRYCYVENQLARNEMTLAGTHLRLDEITADAYLLSAKDDHIAPWKSSYATTRLLGGDTRFVLSSSGHVAGIVNPPSSKRRYWTNDGVPADPEAWLAGAECHDGSWWHDWARWISTRAGKRRKPPALGSTAHPPIGDAPGTYVHQR
ncbi:MAG: PHA/PHB synthase family protein [Actinomycetota bacterium]